MLTTFFKYSLIALIIIYCTLSKQFSYAKSYLEIQITFDAATRVRPINNTAIQFYLSLIRANPGNLLNDEAIPLIHRNRVLARLNAQELENLEQIPELRQIIQEHRATRRFIN